MLTPIIFFVGIGILAVLEPSDVPSLKEKPYECGSFGDQKMRIDRRYLFFARVEYQDVSYWEKGYRELHNTKDCNDQIGNATFLAKWPEMHPSEGFRLSSNQIRDIAFTLSQRGMWKDEWGDDKTFFDYTPSLKFYLSERMGARKDMSISEINSEKKFNSRLSLYEIDLGEQDNISKNIYWKEEKGKGISVVIACASYPSGATACELNSHVPNYGFNTSYLEINFHSELLPHWKQLQRDSLKLFNSFQIEENQINASGKEH
ncbi:hypothetical protein [Acinetobacter johnsonii]|uniref:hypothetical protein n=2 Tax=Acinetobacter johnsonii TaxID=40214 RepID=UPI002FD9E9DF|nr:hypothetical protein U6038_06450 [Acinetobacter johnsonii]